MKEIMSLGNNTIKSEIGNKVVVVSGSLLSCKTILGITKVGSIIFDDWSEVSGLSVNNNLVHIYRYADVRDVLLGKE